MEMEKELQFYKKRKMLDMQKLLNDTQWYPAQYLQKYTYHHYLSYAMSFPTENETHFFFFFYFFGLTLLINFSSCRLSDYHFKGLSVEHDFIEKVFLMVISSISIFSSYEWG